MLIKPKGSNNVFTDIVLENRLRDQNIVFRNSFNLAFPVELPEEQVLLDAATSLANGLAELSCSNYSVSGFRIYQVHYGTNPAKPNKWERVGTLLQGELDIIGKRNALPTTNMPYGFGAYIVQSDTRISGRSGKLILKVGFYEQMLKATFTKWTLESGAGTTEWLGKWNGTVNDNAGYWGKFMDGGTDTTAVMVNLHNGSSEATLVTKMTLKNINKYRLPRPSVD